MTAYRVSAGSRVVVKARSSIHDTETRWDALSGTIEASVQTLAESGARAQIAVDMTRFDAGDWLKNRKLKKDLDVERHPRAEFELRELADITRGEDGEFRARALGTLRWRGKEVAVEAIGSGVADDDRIEAIATFELDVSDLGVKPPKILMFKVEEVVSVAVTLRAVAGK